ncbi:MAG: RNA polymerase sigma factor [Rhizobiaceae bacterium]
MKSAEKALEALLVVQAQGGNQPAFARLVALRGARLQAHAVRLLGEREPANDIMQESWLEIWRGLGALRESTAFLPWALRIVTRRVARFIARRQRDRKLTPGFEAPTFQPETASTAADAAAIRAALATLSPQQRATVALFYLEDMTVAEVAVALDVPVGTVKTRLMHARARLRARLKGEDNGKTRQDD